MENDINETIERKDKRKNKIFIKSKVVKFVGLFLIHQFISALLAAVFLKFFCKNVLNNYYSTILSDNALIYNIIASLFCGAILICIYSDYLKEKWIDFKKNFKKYSIISIKNWLLGISVMIITNLIIINITGMDSAENEASVQALIQSNKLFAILLTSLFAPIVEEIIYRKGVFDMVKNKKYYALISGIIFGLIHVIGSETLSGYLYIVPYGALGYFFAKSYEETDNIYTSILSHFIHNFICTLISF